ncbi:flavin-containing monooxygenase [Nocardia asteroides]|uniref:Flavin-containing monooxygenase n=1 Tax=Nocardia asteroides NBRC 15531 TaxID=1110697 RepID=U5EFH7_NOCAS|nr:NAD(P)/FAD-dependent oxidoreductase [Nocardia asteroides]UGT51353.1 NAD(P)/FAD-dependent oxidoreductase [Nocardia asteroides]GAD86075.1 putative flavin-containing monooxygenase [Nocardia asteroides NBRC 15531]SFM28799.1 Predicted flavoprotein CzcO associated with the cation diffusion facilitator CzcD [Nocardia asteroides]VEG35762.1 4-hydroxyacetophenone monooxygenase [Nocardia asteroides]
MPTEHRHIVVLGAGFGGIGLTIKLREAGFDDIVVLERADDIGGTWQANTYPGCACDVPSQLYSYSFAPNPSWSRTYGKQSEILAYLRSVAQRFDVLRHVRLGTELLAARWDEDGSVWRIETSRGELTADYFLSAAGIFAEAKYPSLPGLESFEGTAFHSLHWDHDHDLTGERVAVIGTGASAVQFVPEIQPKVAALTVFQRSAPWIVPRMDRPTLGLERLLLRQLPLAQKAVRGTWYTLIEGFGLVGFVDNRFRHPYEFLGRMQLRRQIRDPRLRAKVTPDYMIGCKRAIFSDAYLPALDQDNVEVVTDGIAEVRANSIVTRAGQEIPVDTIIYGTGFTTTPAVFDRIVGRDGHSIGDLYAKRPQTYLGATMAGFPNFFCTLGPFGAVGNQSAVYMIESQIAYIVDALRTLRATGTRRVEVRAQVQDDFLAEMRTRSADTVWLTGGCESYYTTADGANAGLYPSWSFEYRRRTRRFDIESYEVSA